jgi:hypothetical protein
MKTKNLGTRVKETVQSAQKQLKGLEEELNVKGRAEEIGARVKETVQSAHKQIAGLEDEVQKFVGRIQEKVSVPSIDGVKKVDDLLRTLAVSEFVEKVRAIDAWKQGTAMRKDLLERFGLVAVDEFEKMQETAIKLEQQVVELKRKTTVLAKRPTGVTKNSINTLKSRIDALEKAGKQKQTPTKAPAKKPVKKTVKK